MTLGEGHEPTGASTLFSVLTHPHAAEHLVPVLQTQTCFSTLPPPAYSLTMVPILILFIFEYRAY